MTSTTWPLREWDHHHHLLLLFLSSDITLDYLD